RYGSDTPGVQIDEGHLILRADVESSDGWARRLLTTAPQLVRDGEANATLSLNFDQVQRMVNRANAATGEQGSVKVRVSAETIVDGQLVAAQSNPASVSGRTSGELVFSLQPTVARL